MAVYGSIHLLGESCLARSQVAQPIGIYVVVGHVSAYAAAPLADELLGSEQRLHVYGRIAPLVPLPLPQAHYGVSLGIEEILGSYRPSHKHVVIGIEEVFR